LQDLPNSDFLASSQCDWYKLYVALIQTVISKYFTEWVDVMKYRKKVVQCSIGVIILKSYG